MLKAVIYDLDGTLVDSRADLATSVNAMLGDLSLPALPLATVISFVGEGAENLVRRSLAASRNSDEDKLPAQLLQFAMERWHWSYSQRLLDQTRPYPGIVELLAQPPPKRAVLTNKPGEYSRRILEGLQLARAFSLVVGGDEMVRKPDPRGLFALCEKLGVKPDEALLIGDSWVDVATGRNALVAVCAVSWGLCPRARLLEEKPDFLADRAEEVSALLARLTEN